MMNELIDDKQPPRLMYAASETSADMLYALGFMVPDAALWFAVGGNATVVLSPLEVSRGRKEAPAGLHVTGVADLRRQMQLDSEASQGTARLIAALSACHSIEAWDVPYDFPAGLAAELSDLGVHLNPLRGFWPERSCKKEHEVEAIADGVALAQKGLNAALRALRQASIDEKGQLMWCGELLTSEILRGEINAEIARHGGTASHTIAAPGPQGADPHCAGAGLIRAGEPVVIDVFPRVNATGYHGDLTRTVVKGKVPAQVQTAFEAVNAARLAAIAAVRPGIPGKSVHAAASDVLENAGYRTDTDSDTPAGFIHGTGHGLGLEVHEAPRVSSKADQPLEAGNVITIEPGLYYPEWGGVRIEDVVVVTEDGCRNLTTAPVAIARLLHEK
mgnify:CR=1 FL=1